jgi:hypothetical protein
MTERASRILRDLIDTHWEMKNDQFPKIVQQALISQYCSLREQLIDEMGEDAYRNFIETGRLMFSSKEEQVEEVETSNP